MFGKGTIRKQVLQLVEAKIAAAEEAYQAGCTAIEQRKLQEMEQAKTKAASDKDELAASLVNSIIGKIL